MSAESRASAVVAAQKLLGLHHSGAYWLGLRLALEAEFGGERVGCLFPAGTTEADAFRLGASHAAGVAAEYGLRAEEIPL